MLSKTFIHILKAGKISPVLYTVSKANLDFPKNMLLLKNPQFVPNHYETLSKLGLHEYLL